MTQNMSNTTLDPQTMLTHNTVYTMDSLSLENTEASVNGYCIHPSSSAPNDAAAATSLTTAITTDLVNENPSQPLYLYYLDEMGDIAHPVVVSDATGANNHIPLMYTQTNRNGTVVIEPVDPSNLTTIATNSTTTTGNTIELLPHPDHTSTSLIKPVCMDNMVLTSYTTAADPTDTPGIHLLPANTLLLAEPGETIGEEKKSKKTNRRKVHSLHCLICEEHFTNKKLYQKHLLDHAKQRPHACSKCVLRFNHAINLEIHESLIHGLDEPPYSCSICSVVLSRWSAFKSHLLMHQEDEPLACIVCQRSFDAQCLLDAHLKKEHTTISERKVELPTYRCRICGIVSYTSGLLLKHYRENHPEMMKKKETREIEKNSSAIEVVGRLNNNEEQVVPESRSSKVVARNLLSRVLTSQRKKHGCVETLSSAVPVSTASNVNVVRTYQRRRRTDRLPSTTTTKRHQCTICNKRFNKLSLLERHMPRHDGLKPFECPTCHKRFTQKSSMVTHQENTHSVDAIRLNCPYCQRHFVRNETLISHISQAHPSKSLPVGIVQQTSTWPLEPLRNAVPQSEAAQPPPISGNNQEENVHHMASSYVFIPSTTASGIISTTDATSGLATMEQSVNPSISEEVAVDGDSDTTLLQQTNPPVVGEECNSTRRFGCTVCHKRFTTLHSLNVHTRRHNSLPLPFRCHLCTRRFATRSHQQYHISTHPNRNARFRERLRKLANRSANMSVARRPLKWNAEKAKFLPCAVGTSKRSTTATTEERSHICPHCASSFSFIGLLNYHIRQKHPSELTPFVCVECSRRFVSQSRLEKHMARSHDAKKKKSPKSQCPMCEEEFATRSSMLRHMVVHSEQTVYQCDQCTKQFKYHSTCRKHMLTHVLEPEIQEPMAAYSLMELNPGSVSQPVNNFPTATVTTLPSSTMITSMLPSVLQQSQFTTNMPAYSTAPQTCFVLDAPSSFGQDQTLYNLPSQFLPWNMPMTSNTMPLVTGYNGFSIPYQEAVGNPITTMTNTSISAIPTSLHYTPLQSNQTSSFPVLQNQLSSIQSASLIITSNQCTMNKQFTHSNNMPTTTSTTTTPTPTSTTTNKDEGKDRTSLFGCGLCQLSFPHPDQLVAHNKGAHLTRPRPFTCDVCKFSFASLTLLQAHADEHRPSSSTDTNSSTSLGYKCPLCPVVVFSNQSARTRHILSCHPLPTKDPFLCMHCGIQFRHITSLKAHVRKVIEAAMLTRHQAETMDSQKIDVVIFTNESENETENNVETENNTKLGSEAYLTKLIQDMKNPSSKTASVPCDEASGSSSSSSNPGNHLCTTCGRRFTLASDLRRHNYTHGQVKPFACTMCDVQFVKYALLRQHVSDMHPNTEAEASTLNVDLDDGESILELPQLPSKANNTLRYSCHLCGCRFFRRSTLRTHLQRHIQPTRYKCGDCDSCFATLKQREEHREQECAGVAAATARAEQMTRIEHPDKKLKSALRNALARTVTGPPTSHRHQDPHPSTSTTNTSQRPTSRLERDMTQPSSSSQAIFSPSTMGLNTIRMLKDSFAAAVFSPTVGEMDESFSIDVPRIYSTPHAVPMNEESPRSRRKQRPSNRQTDPQDSRRLQALYKCSQCPSEFNRQDVLREHENIHGNKRPFVCLVCGAGFNNNSTLITHRRIHTGDKPYRCYHCGQNFRQLMHLHRHMQRKHEDR